MKPIKLLVIKIAIKKDNNINHEIDIELKAKIKQKLERRIRKKNQIMLKKKKIITNFQ